MKNSILYLLCLSSIALSCPTCTGRVAHNSPAYFSDSFYVPYALAGKTSPKDKETQNTSLQSTNVTAKKGSQ